MCRPLPQPIAIRHSNQPKAVTAPFFKMERGQGLCVKKSQCSFLWVVLMANIPLLKLHGIEGQYLLQRLFVFDQITHTQTIEAIYNVLNRSCQALRRKIARDAGSEAQVIRSTRGVDLLVEPNISLRAS